MKGFKGLKTLFVLACLMGGWAVLSEGPKIIWGSNIKAEFKNQGYSCISTIKMKQINPVTWFWSGPNTYFFVHHKKGAEEIPLMPGKWAVRSITTDIDDGDYTSMNLVDIDSRRIAYLGDPDNESVEQMMKRADANKWNDSKKAYRNSFTRNIHKWIKMGRPLQTTFCE